MKSIFTGYLYVLHFLHLREWDAKRVYRRHILLLYFTRTSFSVFFHIKSVLQGICGCDTPCISVYNQLGLIIEWIRLSTGLTYSHFGILQGIFTSFTRLTSIVSFSHNGKWCSAFLLGTFLREIYRICRSLTWYARFSTLSRLTLFPLLPFSVSLLL